MNKDFTSDLIPRSKLFGNPSRMSAQISPDGQTFSWIAPKDGVLNIWVAPADNISTSRVVTDDRKRGIRFYGWAHNGTHLLYIQDKGGDEDWHLYSVEIATGKTVDLTPFDGVTARIESTSLKYPDELIAGLNDRDQSWHDLYRINLVTGDRELVLLNDQDFSGFVVDRSFDIKLASRTLADEGGRMIFRRQDDGTFSDYLRIGPEDDLSTFVIGFEELGDAFYLIDSRDRDKAALLRIDWNSGDQELLGQHEKSDVSRLALHPTTDKAEAYGVNYMSLEWTSIGDSISGDLEFLESELDGEFDIASRSRDDQTWIIASSSAEMPETYHLYNRPGKSLTKLFSSRPELDSYRLQPMKSVAIPARDGLELVSYTTLPDRGEAPYPMVLLVHGGPWARDVYGYNSTHQWLADRGYAVLSVNYRGSTGFGKNFLNAGDLEWAGKMHNDLLDAVEWAIETGIASRDRIAIMGGSYGGYATLVGLTFTPDVFACGVDIVGPSNLHTLLETIPPYWKSFYENFARRVGDPRTEEGDKLLTERSPLTRTDRISRPLLIGQGANDPRVKQAESDQIVTAMKDKGLPVTYVLYPDEGHGFVEPANRMSFNAITEAFLGEHLGGSVEPFGDDLQGSSVTVPDGADKIAGLEAALSTAKTSIS